MPTRNIPHTVSVKRPDFWGNNMGGLDKCKKNDSVCRLNSFQVNHLSVQWLTVRTGPRGWHTVSKIKIWFRHRTSHQLQFNKIDKTWFTLQ